MFIEAVAENELKMVERHVVSGERLIAHQQDILSGLRENGFATAEAERVLRNLEQAQRLHLDHRARLQGRSMAVTHGRSEAPMPPAK